MTLVHSMTSSPRINLVIYSFTANHIANYTYNLLLLLQLLLQLQLQFTIY